ncbi:hypothetical protein [Kutzneria chonburiensis]|uniref:Uncharacterized protein n=1 Tax=Kutzneria chonburiensis TaxID=1483604 RepID=A0ABV6N3B8_9PSEU|nr:hypothetical protein [Kutzneria chonburiensis]
MTSDPSTTERPEDWRVTASPEELLDNLYRVTQNGLARIKDHLADGLPLRPDSFVPKVAPLDASAARLAELLSADCGPLVVELVSAVAAYSAVVLRPLRRSGPKSVQARLRKDITAEGLDVALKRIDDAVTALETWVEEHPADGDL